MEANAEKVAETKTVKMVVELTVPTCEDPKRAAQNALATAFGGAMKPGSTITKYKVCSAE